MFEKMRRGDWNAFNYFFEHYSEQLFYYALGFVKEKEEAEDIVQEVFVYLWVNRSRISCAGSVYGYLSRAVKNACIDFKLHEEVKRKHRQSLTFQELIESEKTDHFEELYDRVQGIMEALPPKCKEIFILGCVEGLNYKEIAEQLGVSVNTVKTQMKVAYRKIRSEVEESSQLMLLLFLFLSR